MSRRPLRWWRWPDGALWIPALRASARIRQQRFRTFIRLVQPRHGQRILDVGASGPSAGAGNYLLQWYPHPQDLTACGVEGAPEICRQRGIRWLDADARSLPFADDEFDIVHCNAVLEHVGDRGKQASLVSELCRVGRQVWLATPDADSPLEGHTLLPFVHWLPLGLKNVIYQLAGWEYWSQEDNLNLLDAGALRRLFPEQVRKRVEIRRQYVWGMPVVVVAYLNLALGPQSETASGKAGEM